MSRHPLCAGPDCSTCARIAANEKRVRDELRDRLDRAGAADPGYFEGALRLLAAEQPDLVNDALDQNGAPS